HHRAPPPRSLCRPHRATRPRLERAPTTSRPSAPTANRHRPAPAGLSFRHPIKPVRGSGHYFRRIAKRREPRAPPESRHVRAARTPNAKVPATLAEPLRARAHRTLSPERLRAHAARAPADPQTPKPPP